MTLRVAILYGGISAEHEVSVVSARSMMEAIDRDRYEVVPIAITKTGRWLLPSTPPDRLALDAGGLPDVGEEDGSAVVVMEHGQVIGVGEPIDTGGPIDVVFPLLHGPGGEDGTVQGLLEVLGIPYVGAGVAASAVGMDKALQKPIFAQAGIPVTPWIDIRLEEFGEDVTSAVEAAVKFVGLPCFTKPSALGSSIGVSRCTTAGQVLLGLGKAFEHGRVALVERAIEGRELECAVLGSSVKPEASVVGEVSPAAGHDFYDYEAKYLIEGSELSIPADIPDDVADLVRGYAVQAFQAIGCEGMARVDFFWDGQKVFLNEINTIPGFTPISMYPKLWEASGVPYPALIDRLIELGLERHRRAKGPDA